PTPPAAETSRRTGPARRPRRPSGHALLAPARGRPPRRPGPYPSSPASVLAGSTPTPAGMTADDQRPPRRAAPGAQAPARVAGTRAARRAGPPDARNPARRSPTATGAAWRGRRTLPAR